MQLQGTGITNTLAAITHAILLNSNYKIRTKLKINYYWDDRWRFNHPADPGHHGQTYASLKHLLQYWRASHPLHSHSPPQSLARDAPLSPGLPGNNPSSCLYSQTSQKSQMASSCVAMLTPKTDEKNAEAQCTSVQKLHPSNLSSYIYTQPMQGAAVDIQLPVVPDATADGVPLQVRLLVSFFSNLAIVASMIGNWDLRNKSAGSSSTPVSRHKRLIKQECPKVVFFVIISWMLPAISRPTFICSCSENNTKRIKARASIISEAAEVLAIVDRMKDAQTRGIGSRSAVSILWGLFVGCFLIQPFPSFLNPTNSSSHCSFSRGQFADNLCHTLILDLKILV